MYRSSARSSSSSNWCSGAVFWLGSPGLAPFAGSVLITDSVPQNQVRYPRSGGAYRSRLVSNQLIIGLSPFVGRVAVTVGRA